MQFTRDFSAIWFATQKNTETQKFLLPLKKIKEIAQYTHKFNWHAYNMKWGVPIMISQYAQGLQKEVQLDQMFACGYFLPPSPKQANNPHYKGWILHAQH